MFVEYLQYNSWPDSTHPDRFEIGSFELNQALQKRALPIQIQYFSFQTSQTNAEEQTRNRGDWHLQVRVEIQTDYCGQ
jgi:hypothetical protein